MRFLNGQYVNTYDPSMIQGLAPVLKRPTATPAAMAAPALTDAQAFDLAVEWRRRVVHGGVPAERVSRAKERIPGAIPFTFLNAANVFLPAAAAEVVVVSFTVPAGRNCDITRMANQLITGGWTQGTGQLSWRIQIDSQAVQGFSNLNSSLGTISLPKDLTEAPIQAKENQLVELILLNNSLVVGGSNPVVGLIGGYFWPVSEEETGAWY